MRVVLDANVLVSAAISAAGPPRQIITAWIGGRFELVASPALLEELRDVLDRPRLRLGQHRDRRELHRRPHRRRRGHR